MEIDTQQTLIAQYLKSRGVEGFQFGGGRFGSTGPEITIENCTNEMSQRLQDACNDALISRGGGGMGGTYAYRQINPAAFSLPLQRAKDMLHMFETKSEITLPNIYKLRIDDAGNLIGEISGVVVYEADVKTRAMQAWVLENHETL